MTARETFKELGFRRKEDDCSIRYRKKWTTHHVDVYFVKGEKLVVLQSFDDVRVQFVDTGLGMPMLDAINQQCKELGWLNED